MNEEFILDNYSLRILQELQRDARQTVQQLSEAVGLSSTPWQGLWFNAYGGYIVDRYASDGLLAGLELHYMPAPGVDVALGIRHAAVTSVQGQSGRQTSAGLNVTLGFGAPPQPSWMSNMALPGLPASL